MDNTQHTYFAELKLALQKAGYTVQAVEDGHLPIEWNDRRLCQVTESGGIRFRTDDTTDPAAEAARSRVTDIAGVVREYMTLIEQAPDLKADGLGENYKLLAEFTGFRYETLTDDPAVRKQADDILYDLYGEENPRPLEDYENAPQEGMTMGQWQRSGPDHWRGQLHCPAA